MLPIVRELEAAEAGGRRDVPPLGGRRRRAAPVSNRVPVLTADEAVRVATRAGGRARAAAPPSATRERVLPDGELERAVGLRAARRHRARGVRRRRPARRDRWPRCSGCSRAGDPNIAQIPHSHFVYVNALRHQGTPPSRSSSSARCSPGSGSATRSRRSAPSTCATSGPRSTPPDGDGWRLDGEKGYSTGALFADWIPVLAHLDVDGPLHVAWVERHAPGVDRGRRLERHGSAHHRQRDRAARRRRRRTTDRITPYHLTFEGPQTYGAFAQLLHAAIDAGIARAALDRGGRVRDHEEPALPGRRRRARRRRPAGRAARSARWSSQVRAAEALLAEAGRAVDRADARPDRASRPASASWPSPRPGRRPRRRRSTSSSRLFEVAGTRSALDSLNLRPALAQRPHAHPARPRGLEGPAPRRYAVDGTLPAQPRTALRGQK